MIEIILAALVSAGSATLSAETCPGELLGTYSAWIGRQDLVSSNGQRLGSVAAIIQQDRANFHRFGRADPSDESEDLFLSTQSRALIPRWMRPVDRAASAAILRGNVQVHVHVHEGCIEVGLD